MLIVDEVLVVRGEFGFGGGDSGDCRKKRPRWLTVGLYTRGRLFVLELYVKHRGGQTSKVVGK